MTDEENAASQIRLYVARVDEAHDLLEGALRGFSGSPDEEIEEHLRIARTSLDEALDRVTGTALRLDNVADMSARLG